MSVTRDQKVKPLTSDDTPEALKHVRKLLGRKPTIHGLSTLTSANVKELLHLIQLGFSQRSACRLVGIPNSTFDGWVRRAKRDTHDKKPSIYVEFLEALEYDKAMGEATLLMSIYHHGGPRGAKWLLARRNPARYGDRGSIENAVCKEMNKVMKVLENVLSQAMMDRVIRDFEERFPDDEYSLIRWDSSEDDFDD
jgi:hypothetical protein